MVAFEARQRLGPRRTIPIGARRAAGAPRLADALTAGRSLATVTRTVRAAAPYARDPGIRNGADGCAPVPAAGGRDATADVREHLAAALSRAVAAALEEPP